MKFYVKSYKEIKKTKQNLNAFADEMKLLCGKGPFEFAEGRFDPDRWLHEEEKGFFWHISWLTHFLPDKQYLLEFK